MNKSIIIGILCCMTMCHSAPTSDRIVEGDIMLPKGVRSLASIQTYNIWTGGVVRYVIEPYVYTATELKTIMAGMAMITSKTGGCITFLQKTSTDKNWIHIKKLTGCYSYVGMIGGDQTVSLSAACLIHYVGYVKTPQVGTTVHELMHALGYKHEQNRADRDSYVKISFENIQAGKESNFEKYKGLNYTTRYDYKSIMQYDEFSFSKDRAGGLKTITPIGTGAGVDLIPSYDKPDADVLTASDIHAVRARYQCGGSVSPSTAAPSTAAPATAAPPTVAPPSSSCFDVEFFHAYCEQLSSAEKLKYCSTDSNWSINNVKFTEACRKTCRLCSVVAETTVQPVTTVDPCPDTVSFCNQVPVAYCKWSVNGIPLVEACPKLCGTCNVVA